MYYTKGLKYCSITEYALDYSNAACNFTGASSTPAGSEPPGLAVLALCSLRRDFYICAPESQTSFRPSFSP